MELKSICTWLKRIRASRPSWDPRMPPGEVDQVEQIILNVKSLHATLAREPDLRPCFHINRLFGELVSLCTQTLGSSSVSRVLKDPRIECLLPSLRSLAALAETHLESHWAGHVIAAADETEAYARLMEFPYYENYVDLTRMELSAISAVNPNAPQRVAFIGSGPLPLTSLCMCEALKRIAEQPVLSMKPPLESTIINIDNNVNAISQSAALCKRLGQRARGMGFVCQDAESLECELSSCDVVFLAALVGTTQRQKEITLTSIVDRMRAGSLLVIRTAHSLRTLLYPEFNATTNAVLACLEVCMVVHPYNHVVNSVIIGRVKPREKDDIVY